MRIESPAMPVWSSKSSTRASALFVPMTQGVPSERMETVRFGLMLTSPTIEVQVGIQYSSDGTTWDSPAPLNFSTGAYWLSASTAWQFAADRFSCPGSFSGPPTERLFVRFGLWVNNLSGSKAMMGMAQLVVLADDIEAGSVSAGPMCTPTGGGNGSVTTEVFTPMTGGLTTSKIGSIRASWEQIANSGNVASRVGYQVSKDGVKWTDLSGVTEGTFVDPGLTPRTTAGITYGTTFTSVSASLEDFRWIRFGIIAENATASNQLIEACQSNLRVDWRGL
jgi:hypothetical protein